MLQKPLTKHILTHELLFMVTLPVILFLFVLFILFVYLIYLTDYRENTEIKKQQINDHSSAVRTYILSTL
jgi:sensor domain CHASE-containing protein